MMPLIRRVGVLAGVAVAVLALLALRRSLPAQAPSCAPEECRYDLSSLKKTDTNFLLKVGAKWLKPGLSNVTALAVDHEDRVVVGAVGGIVVMDRQGVRIAAFRVSEPVHCLAVTPESDIVVGFVNHIEVFGLDGQRKAVWNPPDRKAELTSVAASSNRVYAADHVNRTVWQFDRSGAVVGRIGEGAEFVVPSAFFDVALAPDGSVWVVNPGAHRIRHYDAGGGFLAEWGHMAMEADGFCGCCNPSNLAVAPDGCFVTSEKHIVRVKVYEPDGRFRGIVSGQEQWEKDEVGLDLAVDSTGRILVLDPAADAVRIYGK